MVLAQMLQAKAMISQLQQQGLPLGALEGLRSDADEDVPTAGRVSSPHETQLSGKFIC
jgi:hypothetical protein